MGNESPKQGQHDLHDVRPGLLEADDQKIRRVLAVVDGAADPAVNRALLDPLRPRLAGLRLARPLRFARLLLLPLDMLTVPGRAWRLGDPAVPRPALAAIASTVRGGIGELGPVIDKIIAGRKADATEAIALAGEMLWPRAAEILASAAPPADWPETGLPLAAYAPLAANVAAVFRRAVPLLTLAHDEDTGSPATDDDTVDEIMRNIANEPVTGCAMIARLILVRSPHAAQLLTRIVNAGRTAEAKAALRLAIDRAVEALLRQMEREAGFVHEIAHSTLGGVSCEVRRTTTMLRAIETDPAFASQWPRLNGIRATLDEACRARFARELQDALITPLAAASGPVDGHTQTALETSARDMRKLEIVARKVGGPGLYDRLLLRATDAVRLAADMGCLTPMREFRLVEILAGSDAAELLYNQARGAA